MLKFLKSTKIVLKFVEDELNLNKYQIITQIFYIFYLQIYTFIIFFV
jgi:hypothetical protein